MFNKPIGTTGENSRDRGVKRDFYCCLFQINRIFEILLNLLKCLTFLKKLLVKKYIKR